MGKRTRRSKKKAGRCTLRNKQRLNKEEPEEVKNAPHSFVFCRGSVGDNIEELARDFRRVMEPFTASALRAKKANKIKDFLAISGFLHVSHMCIFTVTNISTYLKIARVPRGPTLYFKVVNYCLARDVISNLKKQLVFQKQFQHPPLIILNNFSSEDVNLKLIASMFQNMFPSLNLTRVNLNNVKRCVLINFNSATNEIDFRHYSIKVVPVGISKGVKKITQSKVPDLSRFEDISEFITKANLLSESEADDPNTHVTLPQKISSRGNAAASQSAVRLVEQGPRMTLQLMKVEDGFMSGEVLYHSFRVKTEEEKEATLKMRLEKRRQKEARKKFQEERKKAKEKEKTKLKNKSLEGMAKKAEEEGDEGDVEDAGNEAEVEEDNDAEWYRTEVGKEPEKGLFTARQSHGNKRKVPFHEFIKSKRVKTEAGGDAKPRKHAKGDKTAKHGVRSSREDGKQRKFKTPGFKTKHSKTREVGQRAKFKTKHSKTQDGKRSLKKKKSGKKRV